VSTADPDLIRNCKRCWRELAPGALVCDHCQALVHSEELERFAAEAKELEAKRQFGIARQRWLDALQLLPPTSTQAEWIKQHAEALDVDADAARRVGPNDNAWAQLQAPADRASLLAATGTAPSKEREIKEEKR